MYRTRNMEKENVASEQFVEKVYDLPVVTDALGKLGAFYTGTKEHNRLFRLTLNSAESGLGFFMSTAKPVMRRFEKPIETLNGIACYQLDKLEQDYPIIAQPTDVVLKQTKETCTAAVKPITDRVKPITDTVGSVSKYGVDKVTSARDYTVSTIGGVATYGMNKVNDVKMYGVNKVLAASDVGSKQVSRVLENQTSQILIAQVGVIMNVAESYVDKYLPPVDDESECDKSATSESKQEGNAEESRQSAVLSQAWSLSYKVRRRAYNRATKELKAVRMRSVDTLSKMNPVDLMEYARTNLDGMREKVHYVWEEINKPAEEVAREESENEKNLKNLTYERRFIATARHLTLQLKAGAATLNLSIETVPRPFRPYVLQALTVAQAVFTTFLSRPSSGPSSGETGEVKNSVPSLKSSPNSSSPSTTPAKVAPASVNEPEDVQKNNGAGVKNTSANDAPASGQTLERTLSTSSSEQQDDQTYAEPQEDSPDSYE